ncbi:hypothetical protein [Frigoribacterium sp. UYMn621]|uniref:hypothetical protein n=1 Tax=Frigoribacterium sp. UYMn621 TaxID=3156343 RepID=UPI003393391B
MTHIPALIQATYAYNHAETQSRNERIAAALELLEWNLFSNRQIAGFTGLPRGIVDGMSTKTDATGGNLPGEALGDILKVATAHNRGELDELAIKRAVDAGASTRMVSKLSGVSQSAVSRASRKFAA